MADDLDQDVPPEDVTPPTKTKKAPEPPADDLDGMSPEELRDALAKEKKLKAAANKEAAQSRLRARELEEAEEKRQEKSLTDEERRKRELSQAKQEAADRKSEADKAKDELRQFRIDRAIEDEAVKHKPPVTYPRQASALLRGDPSFGKVEFDEEGVRILGAKEAVKKLVEAYPNLTDPVGVPRGGGTPPREYGRPPTPSRGDGKPPEHVDKSELDYAQLRNMHGRGGDLRF